MNQKGEMPRYLSFLQQHQDNAVHDACERAEHDDRPRDDEHL